MRCFPFRVVFETDTYTGELNFKSYEEAYIAFELRLNSIACSKAYIMSNLTGELYAYFDKCKEDNGIKIEIWYATE